MRMSALVHIMEVTLGPDTGDLSMRFGLHSGPVTAGVLRGDKSRFQLFGDSVNTAARIETTGERGKIHISHETAELLISAGRSKWVSGHVACIAILFPYVLNPLCLILKGCA